MSKTYYILYHVTGNNLQEGDMEDVCKILAKMASLISLDLRATPITEADGALFEPNKEELRKSVLFRWILLPLISPNFVAVVGFSTPTLCMD